MNRTLFYWAGAASVLGGIFLWGCSKSSSVDTGLANLSTGLNPPTLAGSARSSRWELDEDGIPHRSKGKACGHAVNAFRRFAAVIRRARRHACEWGQFEAAGKITPGATGSFNYYTFSFDSGSDGMFDFKLRYGTLSDGTKVANFCLGGQPATEIAVSQTSSTASIKVTDKFPIPFDGVSSGANAVHQLTVNAALGDTISFQTATGSSYSTNIQAYWYLGKLTAGAFNEVTHAYQTPGTSRAMYGQWNTTAVCSEFTRDSSAETDTSVCTNNRNVACTTDPGCKAAMTADKLTAATAKLPSSAPAYVSAWDCSVPDGSTSTTLTFSELNAARKAAMVACHKDNKTDSDRGPDDLTEDSTGSDNCAG